MLVVIGVALVAAACGVETAPSDASAVTTTGLGGLPLLPTPTFVPGAAAGPDDAPAKEPGTAEGLPSVDSAPADDADPDSSFVRVAAGADLQAEILAHPAGTRFLLSPGIYQPDELQPLAGNWIIGEPGAVFDGGNAIRFAVRNKNQATDVVLQGIEIRNYVPEIAFGAIDLSTYRWRNPGDEGFETTDYGDPINWYLRDLFVHNNDGEGIVVGSGVVLENVRSVDNSWLGIGGHGRDIVIIGGELARNSSRAVEEDKINWHSGGMKLTIASDVLIRNVHVHDNYGQGIWLDIAIKNARIENNLVENNGAAGIFYEISYTAKITDNVVRNNALTFNKGWFWPAGILVVSSTDVEVARNHVTGTPVGIAVIDTRNTRAEHWLQVPPKVRGPEPYRTANIAVTENTVCDVERVGIGRETGLENREALDTTIFSGNTYGSITRGLSADPHRNVSVADWQTVREPSAIEASTCPPAPTNWQAPLG